MKRIPAYYLIIVILVFAGVMYFYTPKATIFHTFTGKMSQPLNQTPDTRSRINTGNITNARDTGSKKSTTVSRQPAIATGIPLTSFNKQLLENTILFAAKTCSKTVHDEMSLYTGLIMSH